MESIRPKKSLGQHFLNSGVVPGWLADAAKIETGETVLEIGPGTGALTRELLARGAKVVALEADQRALAVLEESFAEQIGAGQLTLHHADARALDAAALNLHDHRFKVVANIPYYLSGFLFRALLTGRAQPATLVFLIQKEVAKRITSSLARGEKESLLSLSVKAFGQPRYIRTVSRGHFSPAPRIDSAIIAVEKISRDNFNTINQELFFQLLHLGFAQKRKQLAGNLARAYSRDLVLHHLSTLNLPAAIRAEDVPLEKWLHLAELFAGASRTDQERG